MRRNYWMSPWPPEATCVSEVGGACHGGWQHLSEWQEQSGLLWSAVLPARGRALEAEDGQRRQEQCPDAQTRFGHKVSQGLTLAGDSAVQMIWYVFSSPDRCPLLCADSCSAGG